MRRDTVTGLTGVVVSVLFLFLTFTQVKDIPNLLEPGPRLMPIFAIILICGSSIGLIIRGYMDRKIKEKPYFPKGGVRKITVSYLLLVIFGIAMGLFGFLLTAPVATYTFIYNLKGENKVSRLSAVIISLLVTFGLYAMFIYGFKIKLPEGIIFG
ncbi:tripartite tricarboxylate transporter TctB family protein [Proteiniclasticum ruminis]|uniref:Tripartite tricarboxylate transporter TctB family protein n=1 Tax=Proteiniclasticum ruminis TaxID=398199 RepID=A0A1G8HNJ6_9CLOT|nr:tripartite tricarboxylate transporter TctB family protein [Proteiniclasticum ruminis]SDI08168.1 Tripartite tricarboxylate transporter TctB family protein [Proteiniclasticum ruminis]